jgi:IS1 family transposase
MSVLNTKQRVQVVSCLVEGNSVRSTSRLTGVAKGSILKLLVEMGEVCSAYHDEHVRRLHSKRIQADEIWAFCGKKQKNVVEGDEADSLGSVWTWTAIDPDSKLMVNYLVGQRTEECALEFLADLDSRIATKFQLTTDANFTYLKPVADTFKGYVDFAMVKKNYKANRYLGSEKQIIEGAPDPKFVSTSLVERANLTMRMSMRRFTRKTNAFSKKVQNLQAAVAMTFMYYNFCRIHSTLRVTPAMEAGLSNHAWSVEELVRLVDRRSILSGLLRSA